MQSFSDVQGISEQLTQYGCALDSRAWSSLERLFTEDAVVDYGELGVFNERAAIVGVVREFLEQCGPTQHLIGNIRIQVNGETAQSRCYVQATHAAREAGDRGLMLLWGEYQDELQRTSDGWKIRYRRLRVQHIRGDIGVALKGC